MLAGALQLKAKESPSSAAAAGTMLMLASITQVLCTLLAMVGVGLLVALQRGGVPALTRERRGAKGLDPRANPELQGPFSPKHASPLRPSY